MFAGKIRVISRLDGSQRDVDVKGWNSHNHINWAADGRDWYASSELVLASTLLYVDLSGNAKILLREPGFFTEILGHSFSRRPTPRLPALQFRQQCLDA